MTVSNSRSYLNNTLHLQKTGIKYTTHIFIVVTTYNGIRHISDQIESLLKQSLPCSIFIFDDDSTDGTVELIKDKYLHLTNVILIENQKRLGYVKNFEAGIKHVLSMGANHIALCDQDDVWHPLRLEKMIRKSQSSLQPTLVFCDLKMIDEKGQTLHESYLNYRKYNERPPSPLESLATALGQNGVMGNTILMNRALAERILPFPDNLHSHDYWISIIAELHGECSFVPETLVFYRIHKDNASNSISKLTNETSTSTRKTRHRFYKRDLTLPYKEDTRSIPLTHLLNQELHYKLNPCDKRINTIVNKQKLSLIEGFMHYLNFDKPRWYLAYWMLKNKFIRKNLKHQIRFIYRVFVTSRYSKPNE